MAKIAVKIDSLSGISDKSKQISGSIGNIEASFSSIIKSLDWDIASAAGIQTTANQISKNITDCETSTKNLSVFMLKAQQKYAELDSDQYEINDKYSDFNNSTKSIIEQLFPWLSDLFDSGLFGGIFDYLKYFTLFSEVGFLKNNSVISGLVGFSIGDYSVSGFTNFLTGSADSGGKAGYNLNGGNLYAEAYTKADGSILEFGVEHNLADKLKYSDTTSIGNVGAVGAVGASLFVNNSFSPQLYAKGKVEANVIEREIALQLGSDENNHYVNVKAEVLTAEAEAKIAVGVITNSVTNAQEYGIEAKVGAGAYLGKVEVSEGWTFFGIDIGASVGFNYGGGEVSAGGSLTTGGISGSLGAGLGLGADIKIAIDWSECTLFQYFK